MNPIEFARNLFTLRMERHMTVEALAEALGVTPELICEWECAKTSPSLDQMNRLAKVYGIPLDEVIRNPKPHAPVEIPAPSAEEPPAQTQAEETEDLPESPEILPEGSAEPRRARKKRSRWADAAIILLLLAIMAAATVFLINPEWFPWLNG